MKYEVLYETAKQQWLTRDDIMQQIIVYSILIMQLIRLKIEEKNRLNIEAA